MGQEEAKAMAKQNCTKTLLRLLKTIVIHYLLSYCVVLSVNNFIININKIFFFLFFYFFYLYLRIIIIFLFIIFILFILPTPLSPIIYQLNNCPACESQIHADAYIRNHDTGKYTPALRPCKHTAGIPLMSKLDERSEESAKAHIAILTEINGGTKVTMSKDCEKFLLEYLTSFVEQITVDSMQYARHRGGDELEVRDVKFCLKNDYNMETM